LVQISTLEVVQYVPILDVQVIHHLLASYGYLAVFTLVLLESAGIPVCTENPIRIYRMIESAKLAR
jgi:hypothetical protein